ncbi:MAG: substrate-binding domain-containing protein [Oscillospiraceae bacterium]|jgi:phosphate transport system substrate-binding protein|nr:substrate-binding domain-containing protein [Oscillospiraceae bacterium]
MKRSIACAILSLFVLSLAACDRGVADNTPPSSDGGGNIAIPDMNPSVSLPEYPVIDGSTSTALMDTAIRAYLTDEHFSVTHSRTYDALERLVPGNDAPADVLLAVKYYDEALQDAKDRGADLVVTPIAKEGFIFVLHKDSPVNSLTQQQLRDIYSGKITNWKDVGGRDEEIIPYIRNLNSGSQTAMADFMDGEPIIGEEDNIFAGMLLLLTQVENAGSPGIGYNIYSWSILQNLDAMDLKTVAVDGVKPDNKTLADGSYPLMVYTYSYYNADNAKGKALTDWLLTAEGQSVIASAGYVGIFGELSTDEMPDFYKDEHDSSVKAEEYYVENGMLDWDSMSFYSERIPDKKQTEAFAAGKGKAVTVLYLTHFANYEYETKREFYRFIVLTRERGGDFEVINEGAVSSYENGVITPIP